MNFWNKYHMKSWGENGELRVVVESPRGSAIKYKYDAFADAFTVSSAFALGISYPFDWGFIPGTEGEDGNPIDALVLHDATTFPGVILPCRVLGMINNRIIAIPVWYERYGEIESTEGLSPRLREEIEKFFQSPTFFADKEIVLKGWESPMAAVEFLKSRQKNLDFLYDPSGVSK